MTLVQHYKWDDFGILDDFFARSFPSRQRQKSAAVHVKDLEDHFEIAVIAPGLTRKDFEISLEGDRLSVSYERNAEDSPQLFSKRSFSRSWAVNEGTKAKDISAKYNAGILTVFVQKKQKIQPKTHSIEVL